jgi:hypothetical protein
MAVPTWTVGQVLTASDVNNWFVPLIGYKTAQTVRSTLTLSLDPDMQFNIPTANAAYLIQAGIIYVASAGSFKWTWTLPSGATGGYSVALAQGTLMPLGLAWSATPTAATDGTVYSIQIQGLLNTSASTGTFGIQWCSNSGPNSLTVGVGSFLQARRVG